MSEVLSTARQLSNCSKGAGGRLQHFCLSGETWSDILYRHEHKEAALPVSSGPAPDLVQSRECYLDEGMFFFLSEPIPGSQVGA